ncbi:unnamed protein product [Cyclocybe aegerita]|uniref:F-box domain-containing protein n=1 Tax=Cyclocybe aegerita TaxID=1973307 RepID=A0A8S0XJA0_CYCAE|nr:unnamed protein product [Cyclocybe aegerita]
MSSKEIDTLKATINDAHDPMFRIFSPELVSLIFTFSVHEGEEAQIPEQRGCRRRLRQNGPRMPIVLSAVCRRWRDISFSTPQLWTSIFIKFDEADSAPTQQARANFVQEWLSRSGQLPLSIAIAFDTIVVSGRSKLDSESMFYPIVEIINKCSSRWRTLDVQVPGSLLPRIRGNSTGRSILEDIRIIRTDWPLYTESLKRFRLECVKPSPTRVAMSRLDLRSLGILWDNVTHLDAMGLNLADCVKVLQKAPRMTHWRLDYIPDIEDVDNAADGCKTLIIHHSLQSLDLWYITYPQLLLDQLTLPSLRHLRYHCSSFPTSLSSLKLLLERSSSLLLTLEIDLAVDGNKDHQDCIDLLRSVPTVRDLKLNSTQNMDTFFDLLGRTSMPHTLQEKDRFLPHLRRLSFTGERLFKWSKILDAFPCGNQLDHSSRRPLSSLSITICAERQDSRSDDCIDESLLPRLFELMEHNIHISIKGQDDEDWIERSACYHKELKDVTL